MSSFVFRFVIRPGQDLEASNLEELAHLASIRIVRAAVQLVEALEAGDRASLTIQPRRRSSAASCSVDVRRSVSSSADSRAAGLAAAEATPIHSASCRRSMNAVASLRVNLPAPWRWLKPIGPRASWPASWSSASSSRSCFADAGGPEC